MAAAEVGDPSGTPSDNQGGGRRADKHAGGVELPLGAAECKL
jgi:hypothetical protein